MNVYIYNMMKKKAGKKMDCMVIQKVLQLGLEP